MATHPTLKVGQAVRFKTAGRYPKEVTGKIASFDSEKPEKGWCEIAADDGRTLKARPASLRTTA